MKEHFHEGKQVKDAPEKYYAKYVNMFKNK